MKVNTILCIMMSQLRRNYHIKVMEEVPDEVLPNTFYVVGSPDSPQYGIMLCPCGCGRHVDLNFNPSSTPCWKLKFHPLGTISVTPSIWRKSSGCRSHFFLKYSRIVWCEL